MTRKLLKIACIGSARVFFAIAHTPSVIGFALYPPLVLLGDDEGDDGIDSGSDAVGRGGLDAISLFLSLSLLNHLRVTLSLTHTYYNNVYQHQCESCDSTS